MLLKSLNFNCLSQRALVPVVYRTNARCYATTTFREYEITRICLDARLRAGLHRGPLEGLPGLLILIIRPSLSHNYQSKSKRKEEE